MLLSAVLTVPAVADLQLGQTYNSGYSGATALPFGAADYDFSLSSSEVSATVPVVANPIPTLWLTPPAGSQWISPTEDQENGPGLPTYGDLPGSYTYQAQLDTDFLVPTAVTFTGSFASDNSAAIWINGNYVSTAAGFSQLTSFGPVTFTIGAGPIKTNINFYVTNLNDNDPVNPTGLLVVGLKASAAAPEPGTWLLLFGGLTVLFGVQRLRGASIL